MTARLLALLLLTFPMFAATITVTGTGDAIAVDGQCTLREALTSANTNAVSGDCPVAVEVDVVLTTEGAHVNTIPAGGVFSTGSNASTNTEPASATLDSVLDPPGVAKAFTPADVTVGMPTQLSITLTNPNALDITGAAFIDNYPAGLVNATFPNVTNTCGGTVTADPDGTLLQLSGGTIPANGDCTITVRVVATTEGTLVNDLPAGSVTSANALPSGAAASASLAAAAAVAVPLSPSALFVLSVMLAVVGAMVLRKL